MKFEELQRLWQNESPKTTPIMEISKSQNSANNILKSLQKNMKYEFWSNLIMIPAFIALLYYSGWLEDFSRAYLIGSLILTLIPLIYYHIKFYQFYSEFFISGISTHLTLFKFSRVFRDRLSDYRNYNLMIIIVISHFLYRIVRIRYPNKILSHTDQDLIYFIFTMCLYILTFIIAELWVHYFYKEHLQNIDQIIDQLESEP